MKIAEIFESNHPFSFKQRTPEQIRLAALRATAERAKEAVRQERERQKRNRENARR
jgi:hypothetical protein